MTCVYLEKNVFFFKDRHFHFINFKWLLQKQVTLQWRNCFFMFVSMHRDELCFISNAKALYTFPTSKMSVTLQINKVAKRYICLKSDQLHMKSKRTHLVSMKSQEESDEMLNWDVIPNPIAFCCCFLLTEFTKHLIVEERFRGGVFRRWCVSSEFIFQHSSLINVRKYKLI